MSSPNEWMNGWGAAAELKLKTETEIEGQY